LGTWEKSGRFFCFLGNLGFFHNLTVTFPQKTKRTESAAQGHHPGIKKHPKGNKTTGKALPSTAQSIQTTCKSDTNGIEA
jgi:hypothetical protein